LIGNSNSGIQYRSEHLKDKGEYVVGGYQCDIHPKPENNGMLYHERGRGIVAKHGQEVMVDEAGDKWITGTTGPIPQIELENWNTFEIIATGNKLVHKLNGKVCAEIIDHDREGRLMKGIIALQVYRGPAMRVQMKDVELKHLPAGGLLSLTDAPMPAGARSAITAGFSDARPGQDSKPASSKVKSAGSGSSNTRNISRKEIKKLRQEVSRLEEVVSQLEAKQNEITDALESPQTYTDPGKAHHLNRELSAVVDQIAQATAEWEAAGEKLFEADK